ncbi:isocitrate lyase/PEP mutase family protein (plasmid) [Rhodococcus sp. USK10]|uniref:isocitrate lyase/PEP mutase family protein n=1 Tax=Rhodococcus sp. USK10 TaxID=2789739 RepID=UPI001C5E6F76|nr:isocitrate lyase/PEP mutase family protein [Rhodococcus sp. USK10]QYB00222.1 isocitrate lyase/PEP mutase family protein [Rhodococcus sp. USK10]
MKSGSRLRAQLEEDRLIVAPGVFDGLSAHLVKRMGFSAAYMTGAGIAASGYGLPDVGLVTATEMAARASVLVDILEDVPLIADADTGYGSPLNVVRTVQTYEKAGVAAIQLEDQAFPKRCGHLPEKEIISEADFLAKLGAALDTRSDALIVARTDARAVLGLSAAIDRANAYADAGADIVFVEAPESVDEIERISKEVSAPLLINIVQTGMTPDEGADRLDALGFAIAIHPSNPLAAATNAMVVELEALGGRDPRTDSVGVAAFFDLVGLPEWSAVGEKWGRF